MTISGFYCLLQACNFAEPRPNLSIREKAHTYRIVESARIGQQVKQRTLLNLGKDFAVDPAHWPYLTDRITAHLQGMRLSQCELPGREPALEASLAQELEQAAEHYSALIATRLSQPVADKAVEADYQRIDISQVEASQARSIGAETLGLHAVRQLQLDEKLAALGFKEPLNNEPIFLAGS